MVDDGADEEVANVDDVAGVVKEEGPCPVGSACSASLSESLLQSELLDELSGEVDALPGACRGRGRDTRP